MTIFLRGGSVGPEPVSFGSAWSCRILGHSDSACAKHTKVCVKYEGEFASSGVVDWDI